MNMYNLIIRPLLFCIDPEKVHRMLLSWLKFYRYLFPVRACVRGYSRVSDPFSYGHLQFKNRIGLSAGFDKNAEAFDELADFGFGFLEVGTVTPDSQSGNPSPRIFRLVDDESLISRTGFNNCGVDAVRQHIRKYRKHSYVLGVNINKNHNNPVLYSMFIKEKEGNLNVAYLVYQGFDLNYAEELKYMIQQFKTEGITDLILDLRYNYGGAVELSRYLSASIAGSSHRSDVFMRMQRSSGADEYIRFGDGDDLGLNSIRIICSEETASSSELVISGLRGIDFPVKLFGSRTEGKNVGMEVQEYKYGNSYYEFAPITFRSFNAKDWGDYADGIEPDVMLNNQNADYTDDIDNAFPYAFGDWDNFDFNLPLWYALCDIQGVDPDTGKAKVRSGKMKMERPQMDGIQRLPSVSVKRSIGTFGSVIYNKPEVENLY